MIAVLAVSALLALALFASLILADIVDRAILRGTARPLEGQLLLHDGSRYFFTLVGTVRQADRELWRQIDEEDFVHITSNGVLIRVPSAHVCGTVLGPAFEKPGER
jgi:hypothetical protein